MTVSKAKAIPLLVVATTVSAQVSYYDAEWNSVASRRDRVSHQLPQPPVLAPRSETEAHVTQSGATRIDAGQISDWVSSGATPAELPARMDRGLAGLERGIDEVKDYSVATAKHIQQHGLRGYMAPTPELKAQGEAIGHRIGGSIGDVMVEVGKEMIEDRKRR